MAELEPVPGHALVGEGRREGVAHDLRREELRVSGAQIDDVHAPGKKIALQLGDAGQRVAGEGPDGRRRLRHRG